MLRRVAPKAALSPRRPAPEEPLSPPSAAGGGARAAAEARRDLIAAGGGVGKGNPNLMPRPTPARVAQSRAGDDIIALLRQRSPAAGARAAPVSPVPPPPPPPPAQPDLSSPRPGQSPRGGAPPRDRAGPDLPPDLAVCGPSPTSDAIRPLPPPSRRVMLSPSAGGAPPVPGGMLSDTSEPLILSDNTGSCRPPRSLTFRIRSSAGDTISSSADAPPAQKAAEARRRLRQLCRQADMHGAENRRQRRAAKNREHRMFSAKLSHAAAMKRERERGSYDRSHPVPRPPRPDPLSGLPRLPGIPPASPPRAGDESRGDTGSPHRVGTAPSCSMLPSRYSPSYLRPVLPAIGTPPPPPPAPFFRPGTADGERRTHKITGVLYSRFDLGTGGDLDLFDIPRGLNRLNQWALQGPGASTPGDAIAKQMKQELILRKTPIGNATPSYWDQYNDYAARVKRVSVRCRAAEDPTQGTFWQDVPAAADAPADSPPRRRWRGGHEERLRRQVLYCGKRLGLGTDANGHMTVTRDGASARPAAGGGDAAPAAPPSAG